MSSVNTPQLEIERQDMSADVGLICLLVLAKDRLLPPSAAQVLLGLASAERIARFDHQIVSGRVQAFIAG